MGIIFIVIGLIFLIVSKAKRILRVMNSDDKYFDGSTIGEAQLQWIGVILFIIGVFIPK